MSDLVFVSDVAPYRGPDGVRPAGVHRSLGSAGMAFRELAGMHGLGFEAVDAVTNLSDEVLARARVLVLYTIGETAWREEQRTSIEERVSSGSLGLLGLHSTTDSAYAWEQFGALIGARFAGHPVTGRLPLTPLDPEHPATAHVPAPWWFDEELYVFDRLHADARVLLAVDANLLDEDQRRMLGGRAEQTAHVPPLPMSWCIERGAGRTFYTALGHFLKAYEDACFLEHLSGAVEWVLGT